MRLASAEPVRIVSGLLFRWLDCADEIACAGPATPVAGPSPAAQEGIELRLCEFLRNNGALPADRRRLA